MSEHPFFAPYKGEHVAAVLTAPEGKLRGLVLLLQGAGAPRSHRARTWTWLARALADRGLAAVRLDYRAIGDSTGSYAERENPPLGEVQAVLDIAGAATGHERFGVIGTCLGAKTGFALAARQPDRCVSLGCLLPGNAEIILEGTGGTAATRDLLRTKVRRRIRERLGPLGIDRRVRFLPDVVATLGRADVLMLVTGPPWVAHRLGAAADRVARHGARGPGHRTEVVPMQVGGDGPRRWMPAGWHPDASPAFVEWMCRTLGSRMDEEPWMTSVVEGSSGT
ncbi:MAG TPA: alpha/beta fold hydrolase [Actinomycetota bacterium]